MYEVYTMLKNKDSEKMYLFKCGNFYIFLDKDCEKVNDYMVLKETKFNNKCNKCGFPIDRLDKYLKVFNNINLEVCVIEDYKEYDIKSLIKKVDIDSLNLLETRQLLKNIINLI